MYHEYTNTLPSGIPPLLHLIHDHLELSIPLHFLPLCLLLIITSSTPSGIKIRSTLLGSQTLLGPPFGLFQSPLFILCCTRIGIQEPLQIGNGGRLERLELTVTLGRRL
jgi:hypothetical protein